MAEFIALEKALAPFDAPAFAPDLSKEKLRCVPFLYMSESAFEDLFF